MIGIGLVTPKTCHNVGSVMRAAHVFGAQIVVAQNCRCGPGITDTFGTSRMVPYLRVDDLHKAIPYNCVPVGVDLVYRAVDLRTYQHPPNAFYIFGPEDGTLGKATLSWCRDIVYIPTNGCLNLAACVNVVLYDRLAKEIK